MSPWWGLLLVLALVAHTMVLPVVRELRRARAERKRRPKDWKPVLRPPETFDEDD